MRSCCVQMQSPPPHPHLVRFLILPGLRLFPAIWQELGLSELRARSMERDTEAQAFPLDPRYWPGGEW